ncbi:metalloregulator ArsR/SmtB family transcription factor [Streptomyces sp. AcE210]|uniref:ArsR/SmtB family transcription factor n=2 Tax=Streptomyces TaxID=1883 RepID=UPI001F0B7A74|nr:metalloregulator ArsR/SmtB family transcription factor [Streptomyces sp. AcE210]
MATTSATDTAGQDRLFAALANGTRREVLRLLRDEGPQPVQALADHFAMRRPSLSEHLKVLREAGLVSEERAGRQRIYRLEAAPLAEVQDWLHPYERFWRGRLKGLAELLDRMPDDDGSWASRASPSTSSSPTRPPRSGAPSRNPS